MPKLRLVTSLVVMCGALLTSPARAQSGHRLDLDVERFVPAVSPDGFMTVDATRTEGPGRYTLLLQTGVETAPVTLDSSNYDVREVDTRLTTWLGGEVGLGGRLALGALMPMFPYQRAQVLVGFGAPGQMPAPENQSFALGDIRLHARYRVFGESSSASDAPTDGPGLALSGRVMLPTHTPHDVVAGERGLRAELHALGDFQLLGAGIGADLGFRHRFVGEELLFDRITPTTHTYRHVSLDDEMLFGAAIKLPLPPVPAIVMLLELHGATDFRSKQATALELDLGARTVLGEFTLSLGGGLGLAEGIGTPDARLQLGLAFTPRESDQDHDGIDDDADQCPFLAEDVDGFQDRDGCPDPDNDNDLIPDLDDLCPTDEAEEGKDENEDGCTDGTEPKKK